LEKLGDARIANIKLDLREKGLQAERWNRLGWGLLLAVFNLQLLLPVVTSS
jgi:hypothetical protein